MKQFPWLVFAVVVALYWLSVGLFEFSGPIALVVHFARTSVVMAVLILYLPAIQDIFKTVPTPQRDYLIAGIILTELSNELFSIWNETGRIFGVDRDIFTSPIAGFFSLLLVVGGLSFLKAVDDNHNWQRWMIALLLAVAFSTLLVFVAPHFR